MGAKVTKGKSIKGKTFTIAEVSDLVKSKTLANEITDDRDVVRVPD